MSIEILERQNRGLRNTVRVLLDEAEAMESTGVLLIELIEAQGAEITRLNALVEELSAANTEADVIIRDDYEELKRYEKLMAESDELVVQATQRIRSLTNERDCARQADSEAAAVVELLLAENARLKNEKWY